MRKLIEIDEKSVPFKRLRRTLRKRWLSPKINVFFALLRKPQEIFGGTNSHTNYLKNLVKNQKPEKQSRAKPGWHCPRSSNLFLGELWGESACFETRLEPVL